MKTTSLLIAIFCLPIFTTTPCSAGHQGTDDQPKPIENVDAVPDLQDLAGVKPEDETKELYVVLQAGVDPQDFARENGLVLVQSSPALTGRNSHVFAVDNPVEAKAKVPELSLKASVKEACLNQIVFAVTHDEPNDPYFEPNFWGGQWTLEANVSDIEIDSSVLGAWSQGYKGRVNIGVVDHGVELSHPDLRSNDSFFGHFDFLSNDSDPNPVFTNENHGTSVAGICSAGGDNGIGISGVAPDSLFAAYRPGITVLSTNGDPIPISRGTTQNFVDAIVAGNTTILVKNHSWGISAPFTNNDILAFRNAFSEPNNQIHVVSAGNSRYRFINGELFGDTNQDSGKSLICNSGSNIVVSAIGHDGKFADYSSFGSVVMCGAPSGGGPGRFRVTTTDRTGAAGYNDGASTSNYSGVSGVPNPENYTAGFSGTSAAAPLVSGMIALAKDANSLFGRHNIGHLIVRSCEMVDPSDATSTSDGGWRANGAGFFFNQNYGFGNLNAAKLVSEAQKYAGTRGSGSLSNVESISVNRTIPDGGTLTQFFTFPAGRIGDVTQMQFRLGVTHARRGDLAAYVTSPSGFRSRLFQADNRDNGADINFQFPLRMVSFWGEEYEGLWRLELMDTRPGVTGTLDILSASTHLSELIEIDRPDNDDLETAFEINSLQSATGSNTNATTEPFESDVKGQLIDDGAARRSVWWTGTATVNGFLDVNTFGSSFDTVLHVYRVDGNGIENLTLLDFNDDSGGLASEVRVPVVAGDEIAIRVSGFVRESFISSKNTNATGSIVINADGIGPRVAIAGDDLTLRGTNEDNEILVTEAGGMTLVQIDGVNTMYPGTYSVTVLGFDGNDTITSDVPGILINGMAGDDDILFYGSGTSVLVGSDGNDVIRGGFGADEISGGAGDDFLIGRAGNDTITGGLGNDDIRGISGRNVLFGNAGNDKIFGGTGPDEIDGGIGDDDLRGAAGADLIRGGDGINFIDGGVAGDTIIGGNENDNILGGPGNDIISALGGNDTIDGGAGSDEINGGVGDDTITGGLGLDQLVGGPGNDTITGNESSDFLSGGIGNDVLDGGTGPDELQGGPGNDTLTGGPGFDALHGGTGVDTATDEGEAGESGIEN